MILLVALGGALGAAARYLVDSLLPTGPGRLPRATALVNVSGSFMAGLLVGAVAVGALDVTAYVVALTGCAGGYTTFSTATVEAVRLVREGRTGTAAGYALGTLALTVAAAVAGTGLAGWVLG